MLGLVALALALRVGFAFAVPPFQAPDERAHFDYVRSLSEEHRLPVQPSLTPSEAFARWPQSYQPPLAYLLFAPTDAVARAAGAGPVARLRILRLQNALYGALLVAVVYAVACALRPPGDALRWLAPLLVATLPGLASNGASLNNDALASLLAAALFRVWLADPPGPRRPLALGLLLGAGCLAKLTVATLAPLLLLAPWLQRRGTAAALREAVLAGVLALLLLAPWMARNVALYGDPLAVDAGSFAFAEIEGKLPADFVERAREPAPGKALLQLFGRFGITNNLSWAPVPTLWIPLAALGLAGWLRRGSRGAGGDRGAFACLAVAALLACVGLTAFSLRYYGAWQGRYLYVVAAPLALLLGEGIARRLPRARVVLAIALVAVALVALDAALLWRLDGFFDQTPRPLWGQRTTL